MENKTSCLSKAFAALLCLLAVTSSVKSSFAQKKTVSSKSDQTASATGRFGDFEIDEHEIFRLVNVERRARHLGELEWDDSLAELARRYSEKMWRENFFGHFDREGADVGRRARQAKIKNWSRIGENLFSVEPTNRFDAFAVKVWLESPTHRDNILDAEWTTTGVGVSEADNGDIYITQVFARK